MQEGFWYIAAESHQVEAGSPKGVTLLNQAIALFRSPSGSIHALEDRCTHRGIPLSAGWQENDSIRCPFHGWVFSFSGTCLEIPALTNGQNPRVPCVRTFPVQEQDGWVWVYIGNDRCPAPTAPPPKLPEPPDGSVLTIARFSALVKVRFELAVDSLVDPAHVPFVHHRFFRQRHATQLKEKEFTRLPLGFRTVSENILPPDTFLFRMLTPSLQRTRTTVDFILPGIHQEIHEVGKRFGSVMLIATPLATETSRLDITAGWNFFRWAFFLPALARRVARTTMGQDRRVLELQETGHRYKTSMTFPLESDTLAVWYRRLLKYHQDQLSGVPNLAHPVPEKTTLRWKT